MEKIKNRSDAIEAGRCPTCGLDLTGAVGKHVHTDAENLEQQLEAAKESLQATSELLQSTNSEIETLETDLSDTEEQIKELERETKSARITAKGAREKAIVTQREANYHWQTHLETWQEVVAPDWLTIPSEEVKSRLEGELTQLKDIDQEHQRLVGVQAKFESEAGVLEGNKTCRANLSAQSPVSESDLVELDQAWQEAQIDLKAKQDERKLLDDKVKSLKKQVADSKTELENAKQEAGRIEKHLNDLKASQQTDQEGLSRAKATLQDEKESCRRQFPDLAKELLLAIDDTEAHTRLAENVDDYSEIANRLEQLETAKTESAEAKTAIKLKQSELDDLSQKFGDISEEVASKNLEDLQAKLGQLGEEVLEANRQLGQIEAHHQQRETIEPQLHEAKKTRWAYRQIEEALFPGTGRKVPGPLQAQITEKLIESIGQEASRILENLGWHMAVKYSKQSGFTVHDRTLGVSRTYKEFSGGERFAVAIAVAMAVGRVTHGAGNIRCLFIDEGFGALDTKNRGRIINEAIGKLIENQWRDQVVVITHLEDVKGYFPHRIELVRKTVLS
ncbi:hypothetical protein KFU94_49720 [Chloroflexi bacterium TSY]|nr:hypothetical protein [Chloroflexi bacterium TSY]